MGASPITGGLRVRLIHDSVYRYVYDALDDLGWFDPNRIHSPIQFPGHPIDSREEVPPNTISLSDEDLYEREVELGSNLTETTAVYYVDFYAENDTLGKELINDVRDILGGRMPAIGCEHPRIPVLDLRVSNTSPPTLFHVDIQDLLIDRGREFPQPWLRHWYTCRFDVVDTYGDTAGSEGDES